MKFYLDHFKSFQLFKIKTYKLTAIYINLFTQKIKFFKSGLFNNEKDAAISYNVGMGYKYGDKYFYLNDKFYGTEKDFTKQSWRRFVKLKAFL